MWEGERKGKGKGKGRGGEGRGERGEGEMGWIGEVAGGGDRHLEDEPARVSIASNEHILLAGAHDLVHNRSVLEDLYEFCEMNPLQIWVRARLCCCIKG